eukprot:GILI01010594.1.p1 GENE.GILI01010594.1~~GILI01010594.1.p1  ORF type:complete len:190 (+),score=23.69 GILI01010594.1:54-623(+)
MSSLCILRCKVCLWGDPTVGKSALLQVFENGAQGFPKNYVMTMGVDHSVKNVKIPDTSTSVELHFHDLSGQSLFMDLTRQSLPGLNFFVLVYDCTSMESFKNLSKWIAEIRQSAPERVVPGVLVANKVDLEERRVVPTQQGQDFAEANGLEFFETSALAGTDVDAPFNFIADAFYRLYEGRLETLKSLS